MPRWNGAEEQENSKLDPDDTASWGMRVDYVLPSRGLQVLDGGIERTAKEVCGSAITFSYGLI